MPHPVQAFDPPRGLKNRHVQSLLAGWPWRQRWLRGRASSLLAASRDEIVDCGAGVRLLGHFSAQPAEPRGLAILLHGWEGSAEANYVVSVGGLLYDAGFSVFRLNFRDHGDTFALNRELFHSCRIDEVVGALAAIEKRYPARATFVVGHSLGGNFALRAAARAPAAGIALTKVVAVCPVLRPSSTMRALEDGLWVYREYFLRRWRRSLLAKAACFPELYDFGDLRRFRTLTATTEFFATRYASFPDLDSYLNGYAITGDALSRLRVPAKIIAAADDPVIPVDDFADLATSPALSVQVFAHGGHCAFLEDYALRSWVDRAVLAEIEASV
ncbi:MAG TPA: alpha/beta fold hydrolase [Gammaproteobacteria bacterium]|nr:alpha/beta fold hydrolase [Gammaproteobacteria bacterium]